MAEEELTKLRDTQRSREVKCTQNMTLRNSSSQVCNVALQKLVKENKELRIQIEMYKAEAALRKFDVKFH